MRILQRELDCLCLDGRARQCIHNQQVVEVLLSSIDEHFVLNVANRSVSFSRLDFVFDLRVQALSTYMAHIQVRGRDQIHRVIGTADCGHHASTSTRQEVDAELRE